MKFPKVVKLPKHRSFEYTPRHYDPIKEDIAERTSRIRSKLEVDDKLGNGAEARETFRSNITFDRSYKASATHNSSLVQLLIAALSSLIIVGWLFYGNVVFYSLFLILPLYAFIKIKNRKPRY